MKKVKNIKGFALVETLIGAIFVVVLFVMIFENYFPLSLNMNDMRIMMILIQNILLII